MGLTSDQPLQGGESGFKDIVIETIKNETHKVKQTEKEKEKRTSELQYN